MRGNAVIHYIKYRLGLDQQATQTTENERNLLSHYAKAAGVAVEIGVFEGKNTITIASAMASNGKLYGIDPFFKGKAGVCYHELITRHAIKKRKLSERVVLIPKFSYDAADFVPDNIDFIFIDGDHSFEGIARDWKDWSSKVRKGGIIALHDTSIPPHDQTVGRLGSYKYFQEMIKHDGRFVVADTVDSMNILKRVA